MMISWRARQGVEELHKIVPFPESRFQLTGHPPIDSCAGTVDSPSTSEPTK